MKLSYLNRRITLFLAISAGCVLFAQPESGKESENDDTRTAQSASFTNRADARTMVLTIPAPRGLITDRHGEPLVQNRVAYELSLQFPQLKDESREAVLAWAKPRLAKARELHDKIRSISDRRVLAHYKDRRWLPLALASGVDAKVAEVMSPLLSDGLILSPVYLRHYPEKSLAAHILGYVRSEGKLPEGPINFGDPLWELTRGKSGLEAVFDKQLQGKNGSRKMLFDSDGTKLLDEITPAQAGDSVITTLDLKWQRKAEEVLSKGCERGAFVVIDIHTGEVLAMASRPTFDLNIFIPRISQEDYKALNDDEGTPLFGRAFQSAYPPASTFKPVVALTALHNEVLTEETLIDCPAEIEIGGITFKNWKKEPEGELDVRLAIARSNNPWFYQTGIMTGAKSFLDLAKELGMGKKTGLPLLGEAAGLVPNDEWMLKNEGRRIGHGDTANLAIGQGAILSSPLQVAQMMAGIGGGQSLPRLQLIRQLQDINGRVVMAARPTEANTIDMDPVSTLIVKQGMRDVVNASYGTGQRGAISYATICGKTGTGEWGPKSLEQRLAWFAGFFPVENPRYAFAALYEGKPHEKLSGGRIAAPMVKDFFESLKEDIEPLVTPPPTAIPVLPEGEGTEITVAEPVDLNDLDKLLPINEFEFLPEQELPVDEFEFVPAPVEGGEPLPPRAIPVEGGFIVPTKAVPVEEGAGESPKIKAPKSPPKAEPVLEPEPAPPRAEPVILPQ